MYNTFDLIFFLGTLGAVLAVGFWTTQHQKTSVNDCFRGGNRLPWYAIGFSIIAAGISSEQFVGEIGYAYRWGMPVVNWEWLVFPSLTVLLWIFVPLYVRNNITTMPEYLEQRFGSQARTLYPISVQRCQMSFTPAAHGLKKMRARERDRRRANEFV
jgi:solute:Na+ symporter, SSS family